MNLGKGCHIYLEDMLKFKSVLPFYYGIPDLKCWPGPHPVLLTPNSHRHSPWSILLIDQPTDCDAGPERVPLLFVVVFKVVLV